MFTQLGKYLRHIRIEKGEVLKDMSDKLGISISYLSSIETGKRPLTDELIQKIICVYSLDSDNEIVLRKAALESYDTVKFELGNKNLEKRDFVCVLARKIDNVDTETLKKLRAILGD